MRIPKVSWWIPVGNCRMFCLPPGVLFMDPKAMKGLGNVMLVCLLESGGKDRGRIVVESSLYKV